MSEVLLSCENDDLLCSESGDVFALEVEEEEVIHGNLESELVAYLKNRLGHGRIFAHQVSRQNTAWPALTYYVDREHVHVLGGSAGYCWATVNIDIWSPSYQQVYQTAEVVRHALQGANCVLWGNVGIGNITLESDSDNIEKPSDGSGSWWYSRSLDFRCMVYESIPLSQGSYFHWTMNGGVVASGAAVAS